MGARQIGDPPDSIVVPIRAGETVDEFCKRFLREAARLVGLPLLEQGHFADALIQQYPEKARWSWVKDPTTRKNDDATVKTTDFNYLLLQEYLREHPGSGRRVVSLKQVKAAEGKVTTTVPLDALTRDELSKWRTDFIYRGGEPGSGREAPVSRKELVPQLQVPADKPDITHLPKIFRSYDWEVPATLLEEWLRRPANVRTGKIEDLPRNFGPPVLNVVKMDWILAQRSEAKTAYDDIFKRKTWVTPNAKDLIGRILDRTGVLTKTRAKPGQKVSFGDLTSANVIAIDDNYVQHAAVQYTPWNDALTASLGQFNFHVAIKGDAASTPGGVEVTIREVGVYAKDGFDFTNDDTTYHVNALRCIISPKFGTTDQPLGSWPEAGGCLYNSTFDEWRSKNSRGGDFLIYSDIKPTTLKSPDVFVITP